MTASPTLSQAVSCLDDYDPDALRVADARRVIERFVSPVEAVERVALRAALGRVLAADVISAIDVPAHDNSAMDGFAVRSSDLDAGKETSLRVIGAAFAGVPFEGPVGAGEAVRVMTGAVMPQSCDTVVVQEIARLEGDEVHVPAGQQRGQHRRLRGEDLRAGRAALDAGRIVTPADLGLLASLGVAELPVRRRLRVAFFSTGDELRSIGEALAAGEVYDSNRYTLYGMLSRLGVELIDMGVVPDRRDALQEAMRIAGDNADAIISSGGVSVGEADFTREVMQRLGDVAFWKIAMRPGRPMAFGRVGKACYFGLPGNPVAVMITFYFLVRDALLRMSGAGERRVAMLRARALGGIRKRPGRTEYQRAVLEFGDDGSMQVRTVGTQGSGVLRSMSQANCIVVLGHDQTTVRAGELVDCVAFDGLL
ncbi:MAG: molybdopterin molybdotransferase MoeA [Burkholderiaceae bacterium]|nr:molybdopterin molybdotransferase MoeA [Burkholderiaceae bacterium]